MAGKKKHTVSKILRLLLLKLPAAFIVVTVLWTVALKWLPVSVTPLMIERSVQHRSDRNFKTHKKWVRFDKISPEMPRAVISSEDNLFDKHNGFDAKAIHDAIQEHRRGRRLRGGSTISQQTAKNVFLFPSRSLIRKAFEAYFTVLIEAFWGKERIMEVYLNVIETGRGVYGVEAASEVFFGHSAQTLSRREACLIAACLPNPLKMTPGKPSAYVNSRATAIASLENKIAYPDWVYHKK